MAELDQFYLCVCFGSESVTKLVDIRNQEMLCRERALVELERKEFWLEQADEWAQRALAEIASELQAMAKERQGVPIPAMHHPNRIWRNLVILSVVSE